jgi:hypothetical protein
MFKPRKELMFFNEVKPDNMSWSSSVGRFGRYMVTWLCSSDQTSPLRGENRRKAEFGRLEEFGGQALNPNGMKG